MLRALFQYEMYVEGCRLANSQNIQSIKKFNNLYKGIVVENNQQFHISVIVDENTQISQMECECGGHLKKPCIHLALATIYLEKRHMIYHKAKGIGWDTLIQSIRTAYRKEKSTDQFFQPLLNQCLKETKRIPYQQRVKHIYDVYHSASRYSFYTEIQQLLKELVQLLCDVFKNHLDEIDKYLQWIVDQPKTCPVQFMDLSPIFIELLKLRDDYGYYILKEYCYRYQDMDYIDFSKFRIACYESLDTIEEYQDFLKPLKSHQSCKEYICARIEMYIKIENYKRALHFIENAMKHFYIDYCLCVIYELQIYARLKDVNCYFKRLKWLESRYPELYMQYFFATKDMYSHEEWEEAKDSVYILVRQNVDFLLYKQFLIFCGESEDYIATHR